MKVLSIGTDGKIFEEGSAVFSRNKDYASKMEELHVIVFTLKDEALTEKQIGNLFLYPTNSVTQWFYVLDALRLGKKILGTSGFDLDKSVISTQDPFQTGFVGVLLSKRFKLPLQIQIHTDFLSPYFSKDFFNKIRKFLAYFSIPRASALRVVSSVIANSIKDNFGDIRAKVDILPIFIDIEGMMKNDTEKINNNKYSFEKTILMASRLTEEKRFDIALSAFKKVVEKLPKSGLVIVGDGPEKVDLESLTKDSLLINSIVFTGWRDDMISFYKTSDIFLLTSEFEGYGMTLIEAAATGCPIVTTEVGIAKTNLFKNGENSYVCPVDNVDCISEKLIDLLQNEDKRKLFKEKMQDSIKSIAISKKEYMERYVGLLESLLKK